jgi:hypothetical protein
VGAEEKSFFSLKELCQIPARSELSTLASSGRITGLQPARAIDRRLSIDRDFDLTIDTTGSEPLSEVTGTRDGYPAAEPSIGRRRASTSRSGLGSSSSRDLLESLSGYGDSRCVS